MRSNSNARNAIPSQSFPFQRKCLVTSARKGLRETLRSSERFCFALARIKAPTTQYHLNKPVMQYFVSRYLDHRTRTHRGVCVSIRSIGQAIGAYVHELVDLTIRSIRSIGQSGQSGQLDPCVNQVKRLALTCMKASISSRSIIMCIISITIVIIIIIIIVSSLFIMIVIV